MIPDTVTKIGSHAFQRCSSLTDLHLPKNGCEVGTYVFNDDDALESVELNEGLETMGWDVFKDCESLKEVTLPSTLTNAEYVFEHSYVETVNVAEGMEKLPEKLCAQSDYVSKINITDTVTDLGNGLFYRSAGIKEFTVPKSIKETGGSCFYESGITDIWFEEGLESIPAEICGDSANLKTAHIPGSVKEIGDSAFYKCHKLETLDMPFEPGDLVPNVNFYYYTFRDCEMLHDERVVTCDGSATFINKIETSPGENGLINYTVYYKYDPVFADIFESGQIEAPTRSGNQIANRSLPVGLTDGETAGYTYRAVFPVEANEQEGVFRFSTQPEEGADTTVSVWVGARYNTGYREFGEYIYAERDDVSDSAVSLYAPENAPLKNGTAAINVYGYAPSGNDVVILLDGEEALTLTPDQYTGRFSGTVTAPASEGETKKLAAQYGDKKSFERTVVCRSSAVTAEKVILYQDNNHSAYSLDITDIFTSGASPYIAYNPGKPLGFEVTLSENDCVTVYITSTVNGQSSDIPLFFDEESGTWKGEGYFATKVPGTLSLNAVRESSPSLVQNKNGKAFIDGHEFLGTEDDEQAQDLSDMLIEEAETTITGDEDTLISTFDFSGLMEEPAGMIHFESHEDTLYLNGTQVTPQQVIDDPESFGFVMSPMTYEDADGELHRYLVKIVTDGDENSPLHIIKHRGAMWVTPHSVGRCQRS